MFHDWRLETNIKGLFAAGDQLFASDCFGHAVATGHYAGRQAGARARQLPTPTIDDKQFRQEKERVLAPLDKGRSLGWPELNGAIGRGMQHHCGAVKSESLLRLGLTRLEALELDAGNRLGAENPHELTRALEVMNILTNAQLIIHACLARRASSEPLHFRRSDFPQNDPPAWRKFVTVRLVDGVVKQAQHPLDYYEPLVENYRRYAVAEETE